MRPTLSLKKPAAPTPAASKSASVAKLNDVTSALAKWVDQRVVLQIAGGRVRYEGTLATCSGSWITLRDAVIFGTKHTASMPDLAVRLRQKHIKHVHPVDGLVVSAVPGGDE